MAQLKDSVIQGNLIVTDSTLTDSLQVTTVIAPTASGSYSYGTGEDGQVLRSNGTTTYWGNLPTYTGMTESEIDAGTGTYNRTISPKNLKYAVRKYETANYDNMMQLYYNGYTTMNILDCSGISSATQKTSFDMEFNNEVLEGTYEFAAYIETLSSVTSCSVTFYNNADSSVGTCQLTTNSATAHATVDLSDTAVKMTLSFASSTTIGIGSFGLFPKFLWDYAQEQGFIINMVQPSLPTPLITQKLNKLRSDYDDVKGENVYVGTCTSAANSQTKAVTVSNDQNFELKTGVQIAVKFSASNTYSATASAPCKLNVNSTGAHNIWWTNTGTPTGTNTTAFGIANYYHYYTFDGTYWVWTGYSNHSNTTYSGMTADEILDGTSTTNRLISPANLKTAIETHAPVKMEEVYGRGIQIPNGTDLHDITTPGSYYCGTAADAATLLNCPVPTGFHLVVTNTVSPWDEPERVRHDLYPTGSTSSAVYSENLGSVTSAYPDGWRPWGVVYNIIDAVPTSGSQYAVSSGGVYAALENKLDISEIDDEIDPSSTNPVQNDVISAALTSTKESVLSELYLGITLSTGTDFNTLLTPGVYRITSGSAAQTMVNCPSTAAGRLEVIYLWATNRYLQRYYPSGARFYMRAYAGNGWGHWFEYAGVDTGA